MPFRPKIKNADGTLTDLPLESETAVKLKTSRSIGLSGVTATAQSFNGTSAITIPITAVPGTLLTGSTSISTSGNAGTATKLQTARTIGLSGVTATAQSFNGGANITIPVTAVPGSLLTGSTSIPTTGNAGSATKLATARTIGLSGVTASAKSFDGTGNITIPITAVPATLLTGDVHAKTAERSVLETNGSYSQIQMDSNGYMTNGPRIIKTKEPHYISTIGTATDNYAILTGDNFPTIGQKYEVVFQDNGVKKAFEFVFPSKGSTGYSYLYFSLMWDVTASNYDNRIHTGSEQTYKHICWKIDYANKKVLETKSSAGQCAATTVYFKGIYKVNEGMGA